MRVAVVMPYASQHGGAELILLSLMQDGRGRGIEWQVIFQEDGPLVGRIKALGVKTHVVPSGRVRELPKMALAIVRMTRIFSRERADVVLSWLGKAHVYAGIAAAALGLPALVYHLNTPSHWNRLDRLTMRIPVCGIIAISRMCAMEQLRLPPLLPIRIVYPGVDLRRFDSARNVPPAQMRQKLGLPTDGPLVGCVGRLVRYKGAHRLIEAMPHLLAKVPDARCVLVGGEDSTEPDYPKLLAERIAALGLDGKVILPGAMNNAQEWIQACDVFVHASHFETFGVVVIEAMSLGKPVVAGQTGGPAEIITQGKDGALCPVDDPAALGGAIAGYLTDPALYAAASAAGRRRAEEFSNEAFVESMVAAVTELVSDHRAAASQGIPLRFARKDRSQWISPLRSAPLRSAPLRSA